VDHSEQDVRFMQGQYRTARQRFHAQLREHFLPQLNQDGFIGKLPCFRRVNGGRVDIVDIQESCYGGQCFINLGVHFEFLPDAAGGPVHDLGSLAEAQCEFRDRLREKRQPDLGWKYGKSADEARQVAINIAELFVRRGREFFEKLDDFPNSVAHITPQHVESDNLASYPVGGPSAHVALVMARVMRHLGKHDECRAFAELGLRLRLLHGALVSKLELETLRDSANSGSR
jgi:hypothetical protein